MTREEALNYAENKVMQIKERIVSDQIGNISYGNYAMYSTELEFVSMAIAALREQEERENSKPLTLDDLWRLDKEPVWLQDNEYETNTGWFIWDSEFKDTWLGDENVTVYGTSWIAYRSKPKEDAT